MPSRREPFANIERMRREIGELFDDAWSRVGLSPRQRGFRPNVDVYYCGDPPKAVVKADLAGVPIEGVQLEVRGRTLVISGERRAAELEGRVYQQIEIEHGPFLREIPLGADVEADSAKATYENGILRIEIPLVTRTEAKRVPISDSPPGDESA
jgi:HSP20 family protein